MHDPNERARAGEIECPILSGGVLSFLQAFGDALSRRISKSDKVMLLFAYHSPMPVIASCRPESKICLECNRCVRTRFLDERKSSGLTSCQNEQHSMTTPAFGRLSQLARQRKPVRCPLPDVKRVFTYDSNRATCSLMNH